MSPFNRHVNLIQEKCGNPVDGLVWCPINFDKQTKFSWNALPSRRGGEASASIRSREATEEPNTGWSLRQHVSETHSETTLVSDHPVCAFSERIHFVNGAFPSLARRGMRLPRIGGKHYVVRSITRSGAKGNRARLPGYL